MTRNANSTATKYVTQEGTGVAALYVQHPVAGLAGVNEAAIPVMSRDRSIPRKEQAALARKLFKQLGLKGISVTAPNYSMAQSVNVNLPRIPVQDSDFVCDGVDYSNHSYSDMPADCRARQISRANYAAEMKVGEILARAFPNHDDRSDSMTDYFDYCWSIHS